MLTHTLRQSATTVMQIKPHSLSFDLSPLVAALLLRTSPNCKVCPITKEED